MKNQYRADDIYALQKIVRALKPRRVYDMPDRYEDPDSDEQFFASLIQDRPIYEDPDSDEQFFASLIQDRPISEEGTVTIRSDPNRFLGIYIDSLLRKAEAPGLDVYGFVYYCPFEHVPLHVDDPELKHFVEWRLEIGR